MPKRDASSHGVRPGDGGLALLSAVVVGAALVACAPPAPPPGGVIRLFSAAGQAVELQGETREALRVRSGQTLEQRVTVPAAAKLDVAVGLECAEAGRCEGTWTFEVQALPDGAAARRLLFRRRLAAAARGWQPARVDLAEYAGRGLTLAFVARRDEPAQPNTAPAALWSRPLLLSPARSRPSVLLISLDTLRADRLGCYGYARPTSPLLDAFARDALLFRQATTTAPWTTPAHMSLFTALYPSTHRMTRVALAPASARGPGAPATHPTLSASIETLPERLQAAGYHTVGFVGGGTVAGKLGFARGFDAYREGLYSLEPHAWPWLEEFLATAGASPFFLFFHTFEIHAPYTHAELVTDALTPAQRERLLASWEAAAGSPRAADFRELLRAQGLLRASVTSALYDAGIRYTDAFLARLFHRLKDLGLYERLLIVVTSDHGEELGEHSRARIYGAHCDSAYDEVLRVPLVVRLPGMPRRGAVSDEPVQLVDVAPTVLDLLGLEPLPRAQGRSLAGLVTGAGPVARRSFDLSEGTCTAPELKSLRARGFKYVAAFGVRGQDPAGRPGPLLWERLFDLGRDPRERHSVHASRRRLAARLRDELAERVDALAAAAPAPGQAVADPALRERLRALGYVR